MVKFSKLAILGAAFAVAVPFASAVQLTGGLTVAGNDTQDDTFTTNSITFNAVSPNANVTGGTGVVGGMASGDTATMSNFSSSSTNLDILAVNDTPTNLGFELLTVTSTNYNFLGFTTGTETGGIISFIGTGEFFDAIGDTPVLGTFVLTSETVDGNCSAAGCAGVPGGTDVIGFSFTPTAIPSSATPEPGSLILLGTGLMGAAGMLVRRRRIA